MTVCQVRAIMIRPMQNGAPRVPKEGRREKKQTLPMKRKRISNRPHTNDDQEKEVIWAFEFGPAVVLHSSVISIGPPIVCLFERLLSLCRRIDCYNSTCNTRNFSSAASAVEEQKKSARRMGAIKLDNKRPPNARPKA